MRAAMVRELISRMRKRDAAQNQPARPKKRRKRKAALVMSAAAVTLTSAAYDIAQPSPASAISVPSETRQLAGDLTGSNDLMETIAEEEGVHLTVYADPIGKPTVGVGHLVQAADNLNIGDRISYDRALNLLQQDLKIAEQSVARIVGDLPLYQHEYDALVDLVFNIGEGNASEQGSPKLNAAIMAGDYAGIAEELAYHRAGSAALRGLEYRSERRQAIFELADYADPRPANLALRSPQISDDART